MISMLLTAGKRLRDIIVANPVAGLVGSLLAALGVMWLRLQHLQGRARRQKAKAQRIRAKTIKVRAEDRDIRTMERVWLLESDMELAQARADQATRQARAILVERARIAAKYRSVGK